MRRLPMICVVALAAACMHQKAGVVKGRFRAEYSCRDEIDVQNLGGNAYLARGCGQQATYICESNRGSTTCQKE